MYPILFKIGPITVYSYGLLVSHLYEIISIDNFVNQIDVFVSEVLIVVIYADFRFVNPLFREICSIK